MFVQLFFTTINYIFYLNYGQIELFGKMFISDTINKTTFQNFSVTFAVNPFVDNSGNFTV